MGARSVMLQALGRTAILLAWALVAWGVLLVVSAFANALVAFLGVARAMLICPVSMETPLTTMSWMLRKVGADAWRSRRLDNATEVGQYTLDALQEIQARHPSLGDVRGKGLMIGVEFVKDKNTKEPNEEIRNKIENIGFEHGLLLLGCGKSTIRLAPPLCITKKVTDEALEIFEGANTLAEKEQGLL